MHGTGQEFIPKIYKRTRILVIGILTAAIIPLVSLPALAAHAATSSRANSIPDGLHASGIYSVDSGYGLREQAYAELLAMLLGD